MSEGVIKLVKETWSRNIVLLFFTSLIFVFFKERYSLILGLLLGAGVSMFNFLLIAWNTEHIMDKVDSFIFSFGFFYLVRIVLSAGCIYLGIRLEGVNLFSVVLGLFTIRISMTLTTLLEMVLNSLKKKSLK